MGFLIAMIAVTFILSFMVIFLVLGGHSPESSRLMEITSGTQPSRKPVGGPEGWQGLFDADRLARAAAPLRGLFGSKEDSELVHRLASAGYRKAAHADIFFSLKILLPVLAAVAAGVLIRRSVFFWIVILAALGYLLPDLLLMRAVSRRRERIRLSLPDALDLLVICLEAGLGLDQALIRVGQELKIRHPELSKEFLLINLEQRAGQPRLDAWKNMAERTGVESVRSFVHMLMQTE